MDSLKKRTGLKGFIDYIFSENRVITIFVAAMAVSWTISLIYYSYVGDGFVRILFFECGEDTMLDFYNSVRDAAQGLACYTERKVIYPPLANLIFLFFSRFTTDRYNNTDFDGRLSLFQEPSNAMVFVIFSVVICAFIMNLVSKKTEGSAEKKGLFSFFCIFNYVTVYALERGNILILSFVLAMFFVFYHQSNNRMVRNLSYFFLAVAAAIKIYPALFGLLLIIEKRYKDAIITAIYGVILFFFPFFAYGGVTGFKSWLANLTDFSNMKEADMAFTGKVSLQGMFSVAHYLSDGKYVPSSTVLTVCGIVIPLVISVLAAFILPRTWQKLMATTIAMLLIPGAGGSYTMIFFIPSIVLMANDTSMKKHHYLYLFALLINLMVYPLPLFLYGKYVSVSLSIVCFVVFAIFVLLMIDTGIEIKRRLMRVKN